MRTLILCGGKGTRAYPRTLEVPKPLLEVAGRPVLWHVMEIYPCGFTDFVLAAGFKAELLAEFAATLPARWRVEVRDTGQDTNTGAHIARCMRTWTDLLRDLLGRSGGRRPRRSSGVPPTSRRCRVHDDGSVAVSVRDDRERRRRPGSQLQGEAQPVGSLDQRASSSWKAVQITG